MEYLYIIQEGSSNNYKLGRSFNPEYRLKELQVCNSNELTIHSTYICNDAVTLENLIHKNYNNNNIRGEWFELSDRELNECVTKINDLIESIENKLKINVCPICNYTNYHDDKFKKHMNDNIHEKKLEFTFMEIPNFDILNVDHVMSQLKLINQNSLENQYLNMFGHSIVDLDGFVVDFDCVWKMCGYRQKIDAKRLLQKYFEENCDYVTEKDIMSKSIRCNIKNNKIENRGGHNKEIILLTKETFKAFCMMANTPEAKLIRKWYIKMETQYKHLLEKTIYLLQNK